MKGGRAKDPVRAPRSRPPPSRLRFAQETLHPGRWLESRRTVVGLALLGSIALTALFADLLAGHAPLVTRAGGELRVLPGLLHPRTPVPSAEGAFEVAPPVRWNPGEPSLHPLAAPSSEHRLGTDERGRDVLSRLLHGARTTIGTGFAVVAVALVGGLFAGALASQAGGAWGGRLDRAARALDGFPAILAVAVVRAIQGHGSTLSVFVGAALLQWASVARLVRAEVLRLSTEDFVLAARAMGASRARILAGHLLPHLAAPLASSCALGLGAVATLEATLSFLGLGPPSEVPSWGEMIAEGARHPERTLLLGAPAVLLALTVVAAYLLADALRDASDPVATRKADVDADA
ncbi:MAG: ABC transporter permease [Polyangiaceae bacterium]